MGPSFTGKIDEDEGLYEPNVGKKSIKRRREGNYDSIPISNYSDLDTCRPTWEDMCIAYSTIPGLKKKKIINLIFFFSNFYFSCLGYTAQRDPDKGTWFIQALVETFMNHSNEKELIDLLR